MVNTSMVTVWPHNGEIVSSFRKATGYTSSPVVLGDFTMTIIPDSTHVNDTAFSYTFLCSNCIGADVSMLPCTLIFPLETRKPSFWLRPNMQWLAYSPLKAGSAMNGTAEATTLPIASAGGPPPLKGPGPLPPVNTPTAGASAHPSQPGP
jgi:hypothetical protein